MGITLLACKSCVRAWESPTERFNHPKPQDIDPRLVLPTVLTVHFIVLYSTMLKADQLQIVTVLPTVSLSFSINI
eukprot:jgi/Botrbrau1/9333/Bobra.0086s0017.1